MLLLDGFLVVVAGFLVCNALATCRALQVCKRLIFFWLRFGKLQELARLQVLRVGQSWDGELDLGAVVLLLIVVPLARSCCG